jgi:hypothetical protein
LNLVVEIDLVVADGVTGPEEGQDSLYPGINLGQPCFEGIKALENRRLLHARFRRVFLLRIGARLRWSRMNHRIRAHLAKALIDSLLGGHLDGIAPWRGAIKAREGSGGTSA